MKTSMLAVSALAVVGVVGCSDAADSTQSSNAAVSSVSNAEASISRLNALEVVEFGTVGGYFTEGKNCYGSQIPTSIGWICPDEVAALADKVAAGDAKLASLATAAEAAVSGDIVPVPHWTDADRDLAALRALHIVAAGELILPADEASNCYVGLYCDPASAQAAGKLRAILHAAQQLP